MIQKSKVFGLIYGLSFLWALALALPLFAQSSFIESLVGVQNIGLVILITNVCMIIAMVVYPLVLKRFHNFYTTIGVGIVFLISTLLLVIISGVWSLVFYVLATVSLGLYTINLDIFIERISDDSMTGRIRTIRLTFVNIAILIAPLIMGYVVGDTNNYTSIYAIAGIVFVPVLFLLLSNKNLINDGAVAYRQRSLHSLRKLFSDRKDLIRILFTEYALRFFYAIMVLYMPIYLHESIGFTWPTIGGIFTFMLLPFVLLQIPAGQIADKLLGEKEMIVGGLLAMAGFSAVAVFLDSSSVFVWGAVLFMTRVGAALVEAMNETYFFKQVDAQDMDLIDIFRDIRPIGWLTAAGISYAWLLQFSIPSVFVLMVGVLVVALVPAVQLHDTK